MCWNCTTRWYSAPGRRISSRGAPFIVERRVMNMMKIGKSDGKANGQGEHKWLAIMIVIHRSYQNGIEIMPYNLTKNLWTFIHQYQLCTETGICHPHFSCIQLDTDGSNGLVQQGSISVCFETEYPSSTQLAVAFWLGDGMRPCESIHATPH